MKIIKELLNKLKELENIHEQIKEELKNEINKIYNDSIYINVLDSDEIKIIWPQSFIELDILLKLRALLIDNELDIDIIATNESKYNDKLEIYISVIEK